MWMNDRKEYHLGKKMKLLDDDDDRWKRTPHENHGDHECEIHTKNKTDLKNLNKMQKLISVEEYIKPNGEDPTFVPQATKICEDSFDEDEDLCKE